MTRRWTAGMLVLALAGSVAACGRYGPPEPYPPDPPVAEEEEEERR